MSNLDNDGLFEDESVNDTWVKVSSFKDVVIMWREVEKRGLVRNVVSTSSAPFVLSNKGNIFPVSLANLSIQSLDKFLTYICNGMRGEMGVIFGVLSPIDRVNLMQVTLDTFLECLNIKKSVFGDYPYDNDKLLVRALATTSMNTDILQEQMTRAKRAIIEKLNGSSFAFDSSSHINPTSPTPQQTTWTTESPAQVLSGTLDDMYNLMNRTDVSKKALGKPKKPGPVIEVKKFNPASKRRIKHE